MIRARAGSQFERVFPAVRWLWARWRSVGGALPELSTVTPWDDPPAHNGTFATLEPALATGLTISPGDEYNLGTI